MPGRKQAIQRKKHGKVGSITKEKYPGYQGAKKQTHRETHIELLRKIIGYTSLHADLANIVVQYCGISFQYPWMKGWSVVITAAKMGVKQTWSASSQIKGSKLGTFEYYLENGVLKFTCLQNQVITRKLLQNKDAHVTIKIPSAAKLLLARRFLSGSALEADTGKVVFKLINYNRNVLPTGNWLPETFVLEDECTLSSYPAYNRDSSGQLVGADLFGITNISTASTTL